MFQSFEWPSLKCLTGIFCLWCSNLVWGSLHYITSGRSLAYLLIEDSLWLQKTHCHITRTGILRENIFTKVLLYKAIKFSSCGTQVSSLNPQMSVLLSPTITSSRCFQGQIEKYWMLPHRSYWKKTIIRCIAILSSTILNLLWIFLFFYRIWQVCTLETRWASLHRICSVRHVRIAWQCVLSPAVFYFRYTFIYAVWNAVLLDAWNMKFVFVCPEARLWLRLNALAFSNTFIWNWCTQSVMFSE